VVPIPTELAPVEKQRILETIHMDAWITSGAPSLRPAGNDFATPYLKGAPVELPTGDQLQRLASPVSHPPEFRAVDAAFIRFTSGTTGLAKGVVLSHQTIAERIAAADEALHIGPADRVVWLLSMAYHFTVSIVAYLTYGASIILPRYHVGSEILATARHHRATVVYASPTHFAWLADAPGSDGLPHLRLAVSTTARLDPRVGERFRERFQIPVAQALGLIEVGLPFIDAEPDAADLDTVGHLLPAYSLRLADLGLGAHCREILLSGPGFLDAYYAPWRPRSEIMADGWFHTGDVGELDAAGRLVLRGRAKDVINVMGMKVFPKEVETVLASHPDVAEAVVTSTLDGRLGEVPIARVVLKRADDASSPMDQVLLDYCRRRLAAYKVPVRIEFVPTLPRNPSGKLLRRPTTDGSAGAHA
jgi:long-chain acyl-CoA synthetase